MSNFLSFTEFLNEEDAQTKAGVEFEDLIGGILKNSRVIKDVRFNNKELDIIPNGKLGKMDVSLIMGMLQDSSNIEKLKKVYNGLKKIQLEKMVIEL